MAFRLANVTRVKLVCNSVFTLLSNPFYKHICHLIDLQISVEIQILRGHYLSLTIRYVVKHVMRHRSSRLGKLVGTSRKETYSEMILYKVLVQSILLARKFAAKRKYSRYGCIPIESPRREHFAGSDARKREHPEEITRISLTVKVPLLNAEFDDVSDCLLKNTFVVSLILYR